MSQYGLAIYIKNYLKAKEEELGSIFIWGFLKADILACVETWD